MVYKTEKCEAIIKSEFFRKLGLWVLLSLGISLGLIRDFWGNALTVFSPNYVFGQFHAAPLGILALCLVWLYLKRQDIWEGMKPCESMKLGSTYKRMPFGIALIVAAVLMPSSLDFLIFQSLLASLGTFVVLFGRAAKIPLIILVIYGLAISFPLFIQEFAEGVYARAAIVPLVWLLTAFGLPMESQGLLIHLTSSGGEPITAAVTAACAGPVTMGVFIALFALMMLDIPLPPKRAAVLFLLGALGTWFQSFLRLIILMLVGYFWGEDALWTAHRYSVYILFPLWYLFFAYIYFRQVRNLPKGLNSDHASHSIKVEAEPDEA
ncbi:exosortase/archaeosortase family protein [Chloroflexota bacterium]